MQLEQQLQHAQCASPFNQLGPRFDSAKSILSLTAWVPHALSIKAVDLKTGLEIGELKQVNGTHLFTGDFKAQAAPLAYSLHITNADTHYEIVDPYQFKEQAYHAVHFVDHSAQNVYKQLGAQLVSLDVGLAQPIEATRFAVFAPNASAVSLIGDFNFWDGSCLPMQKTDFGYWVLVVPGIRPGAKYKYQIKDAAGNSLPHKADPVGFSAEQYPSHTSVVYDHNAYQWQDSDWIKHAQKDKYRTPMSIYEIHLGSWKRPDRDSNETYLSYRDLV
ncbi:MAG: 1,4-alpha-glucan branching enzyme, partial [Paraglaciecola sp.]|nr:1,4-alpha-glucan branching enzyme [Paraglaciecola sp.]